MTWDSADTAFSATMLFAEVTALDPHALAMTASPIGAMDLTLEIFITESLRAKALI